MYRVSLGGGEGARGDMWLSRMRCVVEVVVEGGTGGGVGRYLMGCEGVVVVAFWVVA